MALGHGYNSWLGVGVQTVFGTAVAASKWLELNSDSLKYKKGKAQKPSLRGLSANRVVDMKKNVEGGIGIQLPFSGAEVLLKHAFGAVNTSGAGPYTHTFSLAQALLVGLTLEVNRDSAAIGGSSSFRYDGCHVSKWTLKQEVEDFLMLELDIVGREQTLIAVSTPTFATFDGISWGDFTSCTINSVATEIMGFEITGDNALASDRYKLGSLTRIGSGKSGPRQITGTITAEFDALTLHALYLSQATFPIVFLYTSGAKTLTITLPACRFEGDDPTVENSGPLKLTLPFRAYLSAAEGDEINAVLVNSVSSVP